MQILKSLLTGEIRFVLWMFLWMFFEPENQAGHISLHVAGAEDGKTVHRIEHLIVGGNVGDGVFAHC